MNSLSNYSAKKYFENNISKIVLIEKFYCDRLSNNLRKTSNTNSSDGKFEVFDSSKYNKSIIFFIVY